MHWCKVTVLLGNSLMHFGQRRQRRRPVNVIWYNASIHSGFILLLILFGWPGRDRRESRFVRIYLCSLCYMLYTNSHLDNTRGWMRFEYSALTSTRGWLCYLPGNLRHRTQCTVYEIGNLHDNLRYLQNVSGVWGCDMYSYNRTNDMN
jgi:hypothetical protein